MTTPPRKQLSTRELILSDYTRYLGNGAKSWLKRFKYWYKNPQMRWISCHRRLTDATNVFSRFIWYQLKRRQTNITTIQIPNGVQIGPGLRIGHYGGIVMNSSAKIGANFTILSGCLIGHSNGKKPGVPVIGDNVYMSANSTIIGGVTIGNNVLIAPNTMVNVDVPDNAIVIGSPARIITGKECPSRDYIYYEVDPDTGHLKATHPGTYTTPQ